MDTSPRNKLDKLLAQMYAGELQPENFAKQMPDVAAGERARFPDSDAMIRAADFQEAALG